MVDNTNLPAVIAVPLNADQAMLNVTYDGRNGDLPDPVSRDAGDGDVRAWATEALRTGAIPGIPANPRADVRDFVVERFDPTQQHPYNRIMLRPKTPFGRSW
jgi:hypothetical protein